MIDPYRQIVDRRAAIARELARLEEQIALLRTEDGELTIAAQVIDRFGGPATNVQAEASRGKARKVLHRSIKKGKIEAVARPINTPKMPEMITRALTDAHENGRPGLSPSDIRQFIAQRWWPAVTQNAVGPVVWRMAKDGKIVGNGGVYKLNNDVVFTTEPTRLAVVDKFAAEERAKLEGLL